MIKPKQALKNKIQTPICTVNYKSRYTNMPHCRKLTFQRYFESGLISYLKNIALPIYGVITMCKFPV